MVADVRRAYGRDDDQANLLITVGEAAQSLGGMSVGLAELLDELRALRRLLATAALLDCTHQAGGFSALHDSLRLRLMQVADGEARP